MSNYSIPTFFLLFFQSLHKVLFDFLSFSSQTIILLIGSHLGLLEQALQLPDTTTLAGKHGMKTGNLTLQVSIL